MMNTVKNHNRPTPQTFLSPCQINRTFIERPQERLIPKDKSITFSPKITLDKGETAWELSSFEQNDNYYRLETELRFAKSMEQIRQLGKTNPYTPKKKIY